MPPITPPPATPAALPRWGKPLLSLVAGALVPLSLAPFDWWPFGMLAIALFWLCLQDTTPRQAGQLGFAFGFGLFGVGASWIYVSIHDYGAVPPPVAGFVTLVFVAFMALYNGVQCWLWRRWLAHWLPGLTFAVAWVLGEVFRGWFLTGFPWLYLGYAHVTTVLSGVAPLFGVLGLSLLVALSGVLIGDTVLATLTLKSTERTRRLWHLQPLGLLIILLGFAARSSSIEWTTPSAHAPVTFGLVQGNIPQELKFNASHIQDGLDRYAELSKPLWDSQILVWPETAIPLLAQNHEELVAQLGAQAKQHDTAFLTGIFWQSEAGVHNSILATGNASGVWFKQKLVPFGEYVPLQNLLRNMLALFDLPLSSLTPGPADQPLLTAAGLKVAPYICYEVVYPDFARRVGAGADLLLTISNDTWFGASFGPLQHLQMAAMRARELGRYMIRATNNGVSAVIDEKGQVVARTQQFTAETLQGRIWVREGRTPFSRWGSWPVWIFCVAVVAFARWRARSQR